MKLDPKISWVKLLSNISESSILLVNQKILLHEDIFRGHFW